MPNCYLKACQKLKSLLFKLRNKGKYLTPEVYATNFMQYLDTSTCVGFATISDLTDVLFQIKGQ